MDTDQVVREHLRNLLLGGNAHMTFDDAVADFPAEHFNTRPPQVTYTPWHILEHLRITQWDILEFIRNPHYVSPQWPEGYWPAPSARTDRHGWEQTLASFRADLQTLIQMVDDPETNLYQTLPHGEGQTILREILLVADHNAYHIGEFAILRQVMGTWPPGHE
ncbi:MAG: DinB family protein [Ktedonobacteraceae bacterium]|nr:DinB family protein [Ktedonobacteraceae bacterium]